MNDFQHDKTQDILRIFEEISRIPHCSKHEEQIGQWLLDWAERHGLEAVRDTTGNVLIRVPATRGYKKCSPVVIQGHMDMVCEKSPDSTHNFCTDPIELVFDGDWLRANNTTLGADNGIAIAIGLALAEDTSLKHPPLELLYTVEEETGFAGVNGLDPGLLNGTTLLNLDAENEGTFIIGCAGGQKSSLSLPLGYEDVPATLRPYRLQAGKMTGGHSGVDIACQRANAIQVLVRLLDNAMAKWDLRISYLHGGTVGNAIPRDAEAIIFLPEDSDSAYQQWLSQMEAILTAEYQVTDPEMSLLLESYSGDHDQRAMTAACSRKALDFLLTLPHGVATMSSEIENLVETSNNLAKVVIEDGRLQVQTSQRGSVESRLAAHTNRIEAVARLAGGEAQSSDGYPAWEPDWNSPLIARCQQVYKKLFKRQPTVEVIHAGLECGKLGEKYPGMQMISFGPTIQSPHSPGERINLPSIGKVWDFLTALLKTLK